MPVDVGLADDLRVETRELERVLDPLDGRRLGAADARARLGDPRPDQSPRVLRRSRDARRARSRRIPRRTRRAPRDDDFTEAIARRVRARSMPSEVYAWFRRRACARCSTRCSALDPSTRVPWYGPDMSIASSLTARIMETWAHGQDVFDALGRYRTRRRRRCARSRTSARARCRTASSPAGSTSRRAGVRRAHRARRRAVDVGRRGRATDRVEGDAVEFCLVVTQRRHVARHEACGDRPGRDAVDGDRAGVRGSARRGPRPTRVMMRLRRQPRRSRHHTYGAKTNSPIAIPDTQANRQPCVSTTPIIAANSTPNTSPTNIAPGADDARASPD